MPAIPFAPPRRRGLGANVCDGIARETAEGRRAVSGSLAGMFPARRLPPRLQTPNSRQKLALLWGVGAERPRRPRAGAWGANVCDGIARETAEGRRAVSGSLAGMFPARRLPPRLQTPNSRQKLPSLSRHP